MRKLVTTDVFNALRLVQRSGLKDKFIPFIEDIAKDRSRSVQQVGIEAVLNLVEIFAANECEAMIYEFLAAPFEMKPKEIAKLDINRFSELLTELANENDIAGFFIALSKLITKKH